MKETSRSLCYPVLFGHCLPSYQAEHQAPGLLVIGFVNSLIYHKFCFKQIFSVHKSEIKYRGISRIP